MIKHVTFAPDNTNIAPASPRVDRDIRGLENPQFSAFAVEASASQVGGPFPAVDESILPVYNSIHQEQIAAEPESLERVLTPLNKLCTCPSLRSRSSLWKVSRRSVRNVFFLSGFRSRSLRSWKRQLRQIKIFPLERFQQRTVEQTVVALALFPDVAALLLRGHSHRRS